MRGESSALRRIVAGLVALAFVAIGCNSRLIRPPAIVFADGGEHAIETSVKEEGRRFASVFTAFVPSRVPLHPNDALNFEVRDTGEPHTVALGKLIDSAVTAVERLGVTAKLADIEALRAMRIVPSVLPGVMTTKVPRTNRSATERCFLAKGRPAVSNKGTAKPCREVEQPAFDGTQTFYSSGLLENGEPFRVKLSDDIKPGEYRFMCLVHRSTMSGVIEVRSPDTERPTVAEVRAEAEREEEQIESVLEPPARAAASRESGPVRAGTGPAGTTRGLVSAFIPDVVKTKVGRPVAWTFYRMHSISFSPSREAKEGLFLEEDPPRINPDAWAPVRSRPPPSEVFRYPSRAKAFSINGGSYDGEGEFSSGVIRATPPTNVTYTLRFTKEGTYAYSCLVHQSMRGKVEVG